MKVFADIETNGLDDADTLMKVCSTCGKKKNKDQYYFRSDSKKLRSQCKQCVSASRSRKWKSSEDFREKGYLRSRKWALENYYGLSPEEYENLLKEQDGGCAICGVPSEDNGRLLAVDHNHSTLSVRGLLCNSCNLGLGYLKDNVDNLKSALKYLEKYGENSDM